MSVDSYEYVYFWPMGMEADVLSLGRKVILMEQEALKNLAEELDRSFSDVIHLIYNSKGRVVISGIGKSAIVAQKIVATLNSTGTPSIYMHAADAIHGDLGMIQAQDIVIILSKSGETPEIKALVAMVKNFGNPLVAMVSRKNSTLGNQSDYCLITPVDEEADPNNLAPTTSTTLQMALGDAIAVALLSLRGFSQSDFAQYHPGGSLGKQLILKVKDFLTGKDRPVVNSTDNIRSLIIEISSKRLGMTAVESEGNIIGIVTDGDLRRMLENNSDVSHLRAQDIMTRDPLTIHQDRPAVHALKIMKESKVSQLLVVDDLGDYKGVIHLHELIQEGII